MAERLRRRGQGAPMKIAIIGTGRWAHPWAGPWPRKARESPPFTTSIQGRGPGPPADRPRENRPDGGRSGPRRRPPPPLRPRPGRGRDGESPGRRRHPLEGQNRPAHVRSPQLARAGAAPPGRGPDRLPASGASFPRPDLSPRHFRGVSFAVEGDREAAAFGRRLARRIGGAPFSLRPEDKPLYHAACGMASSLLVPLFDLAAELLEDFGLSRRKAEAVLGPLVEGTVRGIGRFGRAKALTGPITRNDAETVDIHLKALRAHPEHGRIYRQLGMRAVKLAEAGGLGRKDAATIRRKLGGKTTSSSSLTPNFRRRAFSSRRLGRERPPRWPRPR